MLNVKLVALKYSEMKLLESYSHLSLEVLLGSQALLDSTF